VEEWKLVVAKLSKNIFQEKFHRITIEIDGFALASSLGGEILSIAEGISLED
jgi:hypothetical protein